MPESIKYPRTEHLPTSKEIEWGEAIPEQVLLSHHNTIADIIEHSETSIIIEEKMDGVGLGIGFDMDKLYIQQRGHIFFIEQLPDYLKEFAIWLMNHEEALYVLLENRFVMFGEWLYLKHTVFYDALPSHFLEYDIYDKAEHYFLSTVRRKAFLQNSDFHSVKILAEVLSLNASDLSRLIQTMPHSYFKTENSLENLDKLLEFSLLKQHIYNATLMDSFPEGFYIKLETQKEVIQRYKWIRQEFMNKVLTGEHWRNCPKVINQVIDSYLAPTLKIR